MGKLKSVECRQCSGRSFTNASVTQPEQVFSHYAAADCMRVLPPCTSSGREGILATPELNSTKSRGEREQGTLHSQCLASTCKLGLQMPDFTRLLEGKRVPLLQSRTETKNRTKNQGFRNLTVSADLFSGWHLHIQRNPAAEHRCPFLRDTKSLMLPSLKCLRLHWERYWVASSQLQWARQQHSATGRKS